VETSPYKSGWWYTYPSEKYKFDSWVDDMPNIWKNKIHDPNHQPEMGILPMFVLVDGIGCNP
jgi:hypothetical protein